MTRPAMQPVALAIWLMTPGRPVLVRAMDGTKHRATIKGDFRFGDGTPGMQVTLETGSILTVRRTDVFPLDLEVPL